MIGPLPDARDHHVAFQVPGIHLFYSDPRKLETKGDFEEFTKQLLGAYKQRGDTALSKDSLRRLVDTMRRVSMKRYGISNEAKQRLDAELEKLHPLASIAFYAHVLFDCHFFIVGEKKK
jgi:hypothetical protein